MRKRFAIACAAAVLLGTGAAQAQHIDSLAIRAHTRFLADDLLAGRGTGTPGEWVGTAYIASQLERLGLAPLGEDGSYHLPVPLRAARIEAGTALTLRRDDTATRWESGQDFVLNTGAAGAFREFSGAVLFAGAPQQALAALRRSDAAVGGSVVAVSAPLLGAATELVPALIEMGAAGVIVLIGDSAQFDLFVRSRGEHRFFVAADVADPVWQPDLPVLLAGPALSRALLQDVSIPRELIKESAAGSAAAVPLGRDVALALRATTVDVVSANVGAVLRGSDSARADEYIVFTAHHDHLGIGEPDAHGDSIFNGFSDNAAGVGMLLAIAEALRAEPLERSAVFLFFTGEERGLLGSSYFAAHPPFPLERIRALINLDAGAPPAPPLSWRIAGGTATPLGALAATVAEEAGWRADLGEASPNSDYWPFLVRGVPAVFIIPGGDWENVTPEERDALRRRWDRYHQPGDHWHRDFPFAGLVRYAEFALRLARAAARQP